MSLGMPFFSVIITTYNRKNFLPIAIESVLRQTYPDFELLIIDDGSTDGTRSLCKSFTDKRLRYVHQTHKGVAYARNRGVKEAKGTYICFLDSDDRFRENKLSRTRDFIREYPEYKIFHTEELWYRKGSILPQKKHHKKPEGYVFSQALRLCCISPSCACIKRTVFEL